MSRNEFHNFRFAFNPATVKHYTGLSVNFGQAPPYPRAKRVKAAKAEFPLFHFFFSVFILILL